MDTLMQKKITEAKQHISDAEKSMKTSFFKRKPDLDSAANSYALAGSCFKIGKDLNKAIECCLKAADCFDQNNSLFNSAKQHEQVGFMASELKNYTLLFESFQKAAELMITGGTRDSASILLERGANMLKLTDPEKSLKLYRRALQIAEVEEKTHEMVSFYENAITLAIRINQLNEAIDLIDESFTVLDKVGSSEQIHKYLLTAVLIYLSRDDWVSAKNYLDKTSSRYESSSNGKLFGRVDDLLQAYDEKDDEKFKDLIKNYLSYAIDNEALKIANKIVKSEDWLKSLEDNKPKTIPKPQSNSHSLNYTPQTERQPKSQPQSKQESKQEIQAAPQAYDFQNFEDELEDLEKSDNKQDLIIQEDTDEKKNATKLEDEEDEFSEGLL